MPKPDRRHRRHDLIYMALAAIVLLGGYSAFRWMFFAGEGAVFVQETILVMLGAVATIFITATLLNRQTELELRKEGTVLLLEQKNSIYMAAIEKVADIVEGRRYDDDLIDDLRVLNHKLAIVGSGAVIAAFHHVLDQLQVGLRYGELDEQGAERVMHAVAEVTVAMRADMLAETSDGENEAIQEAIRSNSRGMERLDDLGGDPGA